MKYYYITEYRQYPIYEPAEGGYYYEGTEIVQYTRTTSIKRARKILRQMVLEAKPWEDTPHTEEEIREALESTKNHFYIFTKFIGEGMEWHIETKLRKNEHGWRPYC